MQSAGIEVCAGIDLDPSCRYPFEANVGAEFHECDLFEMSPDFVDSLFVLDRPRVLSGCAPCQPFSTYTNGRRNPNNQWKLLDKFAEIVEEVRPEIVTMENVSLLANHAVFTRFANALRSAGYRISSSVVRCSDYEVPQSRKRLVLLASLLDEIVLEPPGQHRSGGPTVRETIGRMEPLPAGGVSTHDPLHRCSGLSETNMRRIRSSVPGGTWRDWDPTLRAACHRKVTGRTYSSVYGRMSWERLAPTITTQFHGYGNGRFGHPEQDRAISLREGALLQTFPEDYSFVAPGEAVHVAHVARLIGNAVPVALGAAIGRSIIAHLESLS
ncbi:MAG: DNA cytosine methyltransferase [Acidimicrobiaceae bacterium]|nr:DNA cytosine methyltransferase [Acidimicrobiaceae bacterium]MYD05659.1 DNA cytosine methyltransferase [Acidimicrobiaceae bacterium]MYI57684.1 DNA cytosine methyltransferase [Acidimicrobiaceae bacterium]